jgi:thiamine pyrophosphate-dependent acetolactate synthase large subunit-like protein
MQVHDAIIRFLSAENVDRVFTLMAEDIMGLTSTIQAEWDDEIGIIESRHEQWAVAMADGYARASGEIGVCAIGRGPAIAQTGTAIGTAREKGSKVLILVPETPLSSTEDVKGFQQQSYLETMVGNVESIRDKETLVPTFADVFRRLHEGSGPIAVQIPWDLLDAEIELSDNWQNTTIGTPPVDATDSRLEPSDTKVQEAVDLYLESDATVPPLILAGEGAVKSDAKEAIEVLAERTSGLLATTLQAQGYFSEHPFSVGFSGTFGTDLANEYVSQSDYVLAVGCSLNNHTTDDGHLVDDATVVHIDTNPTQINQFTSADLGIIGDATATVEKMVDQLEKENIDFSGKFWTENVERRIAESSPFDEREFPEKPGRVDPRDVIPKFDEALPTERLIVTDGGHFVNWVLDGMTISDPDDYIWTIDFGSVGVGLPIGLGASQTLTDRTPIIFCGDGGFMMSMQELNTAVRNDIPAIIIVMNDDALGSEYQQLAARGGNTEAALIETPDIASVAEGFGAEGYTIRSPADVDEVHDRLAQPLSGPIVVDCKVDPDVKHRFYDTAHEM